MVHTGDVMFIHCQQLIIDIELVTVFSWAVRDEATYREVQVWNYTPVIQFLTSM